MSAVFTFAWRLTKERGMAPFLLTIGKTLANESSGHPANYRERGHVAGHYGTSGDDSAIADASAGHDNNIRTDPRISAYARTFERWSSGKDDRAARDIENVIVANDLYSWPEHGVGADLHARVYQTPRPHVGVSTSDKVLTDRRTTTCEKSPVHRRQTQTLAPVRSTEGTNEAA
jgi:hypothetical protein